MNVKFTHTETLTKNTSLSQGNKFLFRLEQQKDESFGAIPSMPPLGMVRNCSANQEI